MNPICIVFVPKRVGLCGYDYSARYPQRLLQANC